MKRILLFTVWVVSAVLSSGSLIAQSFTATYDFGSANSTSGRTDPTPPPVVDGVTFSSFKAVAPAGNSNNLSDNPNASGRFSFTGWPLGASNGSNTFTGAIDLGQYYEVTIAPENYYSLVLDSIMFTVQRSGTGIRQYAVRWSNDNFAANLAASVFPANTNLQVVASNVFQVADASTTAQNGSRITITNTAVTAPITFRFYGFNAEGSGGTFSIDNVGFYGSSSLSPTAPIIQVGQASLSFEATAAGSISQPVSYSIKGSNLTDPLSITVQSPFSISRTQDGTYSTSIIIPVAEANADNVIYARFSPQSAGSFNGTITHSSGSATQRWLPVHGEGINPNNFNFDFNTCSDGGNPGSGFIAYSVTGAQKWACTTFGNNSTNGVNMNGYSGGAQENEDWLISPPLNLSATALPVLSFWSRGEFNGPSLQLLVSTNYAGNGDPNLADWTDLRADFPLLNNTWTFTDGIDLSSYKTFEKVFVAFKYISSVDEGAARWSIDDVNISNPTKLLYASPAILNFGEATAGTNSSSLPVNVKVIGYGNVTITAPAGFQLSLNNTDFASQIALPQATAQAGTTLFARFAPADKQLKIEGYLRFAGTNLDSAKVMLTGTSYPRAETLDVGTYNLSFFGSNPTNSPTESKIKTQVSNIATILQKLNLDVVGVEEVSNDQAFDSLIAKLPTRRGILSPRWSYSFTPPDPNFPPQKVGFIYDTISMKLVSSRAMFASLYDSARGSYPSKLPGYPDAPVSFWSGGRLPFMATFDATINGVTKRVVVIDIHAKSSTDANSYNRRVYDAKVLYDTLQAYYSNDNVIIVGDYNDGLTRSNYNSASSPYKPFVDNTDGYVPLTLPSETAGKITYLGSSGFLDHIISANELSPYYIQNSTEVEDPRGYISSYSETTASDHFPVYTRYNFAVGLPVTLLQFQANKNGSSIKLTWQTATEVNNDHFELERSGDGTLFKSITSVKGKGNSTTLATYQAIDNAPLSNRNYYRLKQVDRDGKVIYSQVVLVVLNGETFNVKVYPNPFTSRFQLTGLNAGSAYNLRLCDVNGKLLYSCKGTPSVISDRLSTKIVGMPAGIYQLQLLTGEKIQSIKLMKL